MTPADVVRVWRKTLRAEAKGSHTEHDAALYEARRGMADDVDDRPTLAEAIRDECAHLHQTDTADFDAFPPEDAVWVCRDCGQVSDADGDL